ncbi:hypothetical protein ACFE04_001145 [Oxalis oulophora]
MAASAIAIAKKGKLVYELYRALTYGLSPLLHLHVYWRRLRGREHHLRWTERLGRPSLPRPRGPLLWFHAVSLGEGMAAIPVINQSRERRPDLNILMTSTTLTGFEVIKDCLPSDVIYQFFPVDTPSAVDAFIGHWKPNAIVVLENELWPNLIMTASRHGIALALLNARLSPKSFKRWSGTLAFPLVSLLLSKFSLIVPLSTSEAVRLQLLQAPPFVINFSGDLKYVAGNNDPSKEDRVKIEDLKVQLTHRPVWLASSIHRGEEEESEIYFCYIGAHMISISAVMLEVHKVLMQMLPNLVTIIVPRDPQHGREIAQKLQKSGQNVVLRSEQEKLLAGATVYVVDTLGELRYLYRLSPIAVVGGSFLPGLAGHNIAEAAAAGCAILTGYQVGHFSHMIQEMKQLNPLSVLQVSGKGELEQALKELFNDTRILQKRRTAAQEAFRALSDGIVTNVWNLLDIHVFRKAGFALEKRSSLPCHALVGSNK